MSDPMRPTPYRVADRRRETADSSTLLLEPVAAALPGFEAGQFTMLCAPGIGEIAVSISGGEDGTLSQTVRDVGAVSRALHDARRGSIVGVRGPFGTSWNLAAAEGADVVIVAGGVGLAPLRGLVRSALANRHAFGRVTVIVGARGPQEFLFRDELSAWSERPDVGVELTVDLPQRGWSGTVGFVSDPLARLDVQPARTFAFLCGPEPMMRICAEVLERKRVPAGRIRLSLERNMKCGVGLCGHCQLGPLLVCRDGPVVTYDVAAPLLVVREL